VLRLLHLKDGFFFGDIIRLTLCAAADDLAQNIWCP